MVTARAAGGGRGRPGPPRRGLTLTLAALGVLALSGVVGGSGGDGPALAPALLSTVAASEGSFDDDAAGEDGTAEEDEAGTAGAAQAGGADDDVPGTPAFATVDGLVLHLPGRPVVLGYHEASSPEALELTPVGRALVNHNPTKFEPPAGDEDGPDYLVLSSRGRPYPATSAVDVVLVDDDVVLSPVTGTVTDVRAYDLYGQHPDHRVELTPDDAPDLRVVLIHLDDVTVAAGDRVVAGGTPLAGTARRFSFPSQIDRETDPERWPHVHLEVKRADGPGADGP